MAVAKIDMVVEKGTDFSALFTLRDDNNQIINLSSYSVAAKYSYNYVSSTKYDFSVSIVNPTQGEIQIKLNPAQTSALKLPRYVYDIVITAPVNIGGEKARVVEGILEVSPGVS